MCTSDTSPRVAFSLSLPSSLPPSLPLFPPPHSLFGQEAAARGGGGRVELASYCNALQFTATYCHTLPHTATHCHTLQHTAPHCRRPQVEETSESSSTCTSAVARRLTLDRHSRHRSLRRQSSGAGSVGEEASLESLAGGSGAREVEVSVALQEEVSAAAGSRGLSHTAVLASLYESKWGEGGTDAHAHTRFAQQQRAAKAPPAGPGNVPNIHVRHVQTLAAPSSHHSYVPHHTLRGRGEEDDHDITYDASWHALPPHPPPRTRTPLAKGAVKRRASGLLGDALP